MAKKQLKTISDLELMAKDCNVDNNPLFKSTLDRYITQINVLEDLKKEHKKARHLPYAYKIGNTAKNSDDKEPSHTAGLPIYNIIERKQLTNCLVVVIRYFGGIKLGAGGLLRAYSEAANLATNIEKEW